MEGFIDKNLPAQKLPHATRCREHSDLAIREVAFSGVFLILEPSIPERLNSYNTHIALLPSPGTNLYTLHHGL